MADKTKTIKEATDQELDDLLIRLRKESELQSLIGVLKRRSAPQNSFAPYEEQPISTEAPIDSLYHFGIPGMKWGVRRSRGSDGKVKTSGSSDYVESRALKIKGAKNLSTKELKDLTQRLQLEKQYKELNPTQYKKAMNFVKGITAVGTTVASLYAVSKTPLGQDIAGILKKIG